MEIELRLLRCALALAEHGNFARGAKAVHMSQPSLSRNIQELERRLGVKLFARNPRGVEATPAGLVLLKQAGMVMAHADELVHEMSLLHGLEKSELSIGAGVYPGQMFVDRAVGRLIRDHPEARVSIDYGNTYQLLPHLLKREFDLGVMYVPQSLNPQFDVTRLKPHQIYFVVRSGHPLAGSPMGASLAEILEYPTCTTGRMPPEMIQHFRKASKHPASSKVKSVPAIGCESLAMIKSIVAESDTAGLLPLNVILAEVEAGTMTVLPVVEPWMQFRYGVIRLKHRSLPSLAEKFIQLTVEVDAELAEVERQKSRSLLRGSSGKRKDAARLLAVPS